MASKEITPSQYGELIGQSVQNITKHLRAGNKLEGVKEVKTFSRFYILVVDSNFFKTKSREYFIPAPPKKP